MSSHAWAIIALFLWTYSHQMEHLYDRRGGEWRLWVGVVFGLAAGLAALITVLCVLRDSGFRGPFG